MGRKPWRLITLFWLLAIGGCCAALPAAEPGPSARAALALAEAKAAKAPRACPACGQRGCSCGCGGDPAFCTCNGPVTRKATDGGPDWRWDGKEQCWWRLKPQPVADRAVLPHLPMFFVPRPMPMLMPMTGGCRGGG